MKPAFESIHPGNSSFLVRKFEEKNFASPYHIHPEYELTLILEGHGKRYVGANMNDFVAGDFVLLGSNLPHCWKSDQQPSEAMCASVVIQFQADFMGREFFMKPETAHISDLLSASMYGIQFNGDTLSCKNKMIALVNEEDPFQRLLSFLEILQALAADDRFILINSHGAYAEVPLVEKKRLNAVMGYIVENFQEKVSLHQAAAAANMTPHAFCKYFKKISRKTFIEAVTDYRIDYATRELIHTDKPVEQIGFASGFNDISNFYKTFKDRLKVSPLAYRNSFIKKLQDQRF